MKNILFTLLLTISFFTYGQKKELKKAQKLIGEEFYNEALDVLENNKELILSSDIKYQAHFYYLKGWALKEDSQSLKAVVSLRKSIELERSIRQKKYIEDANIKIQNAGAELVNSAVEDNKNDKFLEASRKLYDAYLMDIENEVNIDYLYFAAGSAVNGGEFDIALEYYLKLQNMGYTGIVSEYFITLIETGVEEKVDKVQFNLFKTSEDYTNPRIGKTESRLPEIMKNIALIYVKKGEVDLALSSMKGARELNPNNVGLILEEANLQVRLNNKEKQKELFELAMKLKPNDPVLYLNLGILNRDEGNLSDAFDYFTKAIEIDKNFVSAYTELYNLVLNRRDPIRKKMDSLGNSKNDNILYRKYQKEIDVIYLQCVSYLEKIVEIEPDNIDMLQQIVNLFYNLEKIPLMKKYQAQLNEIKNQ